MVESRRKHGSFDSRYPLLSKPEPPTWVLRADEGLEWTAFLARFFPGARRHDIAALAAYGAYRDTSRQPSAAGYGSPASGSAGGHARTAHRPERLPAMPAPTGGSDAAVTSPSPALAVWEGEGGGAG